MRGPRIAVRSLKGSIVAVATLALLAANDPRLAPRAPSPGHRHEVVKTCCGAVKSCCSGPAPVDRLAPTTDCACCPPSAPTPPPTEDAREAAVTSERDELDAPEAVAAVAPPVFPRAESADTPPTLRAPANEPPIFLRTCHLRF